MLISFCYEQEEAVDIAIGRRNIHSRYEKHMRRAEVKEENGRQRNHKIQYTVHIVGINNTEILRKNV